MKTPVTRNTMRRIFGRALCRVACVLICGTMFVQSGHALAAGEGAVFDRFADTRAATQYWKQARDYERQMRYELARQQYLLALAACRSESTQRQLRRELESVDLQIRTMR